MVSVCRSNFSDDVSEVIGYGPFAGVMVTVTSKDAEWTTVSGSDPTVGYMAVRGYCDALIRDDFAVKGSPLITLGGEQAGYMGTIDGGLIGTNYKDTPLSQDIGILLEDTDTSGLMKVWLR